jgi:CRISPR-associated protein (TIGR02584 family)
MDATRDAWREVLIVTGGMTPQVVTETVYALAKRAPDPLIPAKIVCVVTGGSRQRFGAPLAEALASLCDELGIAAAWGRRPSPPAPPNPAPGLMIEVLCDADGGVIDDIRSDGDATRFADFVSQIVRREALDPGARIHLSLAGGRKTMSFHGGMAMSLFGRPQDELLHVLVHPPDFEQCPEFWFPTRDSLPLRAGDGRILDARDCDIEAALIPFIRLRDFLPQGLAGRVLDYASYVRQLNAVLGATPLSLELVTSECRVRIADIDEFTLPHTEFALYQLMAEWRRDGCAGAGPDGVGPKHRGWLTAEMFECPAAFTPNPVERYIAIYTDTFRVGTLRAGDIVNRITPSPTNGTQRSGNRKHFREWKSRLNRALQKRLHHAALAERLGAPLQPVKVRPGNRVVFGLHLDPGAIVILTDEPLGRESAQ